MKFLTMSKLILISFLLLTMCLPTSVCAYGKTTIDPNITKLKVSEAIPNEGDVTQKVTYEAKRQTVLSILIDLSKMTGVTLKAGYNNQDWQVRDRKMNIFAKDIPLSSLMNSIARVMKFKWSKSEKNGVVSYRLYMDRKTVLGAENQKLMEEKRVRKHQLEGRQRFLSAMEAAAGMSYDDLEKLKTESPYIYKMTKQWKGFFPKLLAASPSAKQAYLSGEEFAVDIGSLSPEIKQKFVQVMSTKAHADTTGLKMNIEFRGLDMPGLSSRFVGRAGNPDPEIYPYPFSGMGGMKFELKTGELGMAGYIGFQDPESRASRIDDEFLGAIMRNDKSDIEKLSSEVTIAAKAEIADLGEPLIEHPDDPELSVKVKMHVEDHEFTNALAALADSSGFAVVSDSFDKEFSTLTFQDDKIEIKSALSRIESECRYNWEKHGSTLELHARDWYRKRANQIPEAWLDVWRKAFKAKGMLDIDELSQMATFTAEQFNANIRSDDVLKHVSISGIENRELLRLYATLDKQQRAMLFTKEGLSIDSISSNQSPILQTILQSSSGTKKGLSLLCKLEKRENPVWYWYTFGVITSSGDATDRQWQIHAPVYIPSVEEKPKDAKSQQSEKQGDKH